MTQYNQPLNKDVDGQKITATYENGEWVTPVRARQAGIIDFAHNVVNVIVGGGATEAKAGSTALDKRYQMVIYPPSVGTVYWGTIGVNLSNGLPLTAGDAPLGFDFSPDVYVPIFLVNDGTNRSVRVVELK